MICINMVMILLFQWLEIEEKFEIQCIRAIESGIYLIKAL